MNMKRKSFIPTFTMDELKLDVERCGVKGSPTKVYKIESVVLAGGNHLKIENTKLGIGNLIEQLMADHILDKELYGQIVK